MILSITDRESFLNNFLSVVSKVTESAVIKVTKGRLETVISTSDSTGIVSVQYTNKSIDCETTLNVPDIKKFYRIIQCIDKPDFDLVIDNNSISYNSKSVRFKYHLYEDGIIAVPKINLEKLKNIDFDCAFTLLQTTINSLVKGSTIATDTNKIYFTFKDNEVYGELTDYARPNIDSYGLMLSSDFDGKNNLTPLPLNFEIFRIISSMKFNLIMCLLSSTLGVMTFNIDSDNTSVKFIISGLAN